MIKELLERGASVQDLSIALHAKTAHGVSIVMAEGYVEFVHLSHFK
jgi:hypothetical protein